MSREESTMHQPAGFDLEAFHAQAVETPSHRSVEAMRTMLVDTLTEAGFSPRVDDTGTVIVSRGEADPAAAHFVLNTHLDTVKPHVPYSRDGDVVRGRGACDSKGSLAALLAAFCRVDPGAGALTMAVTPDEETTQSGAGALAPTLSADGYIVGEPTGLDVCVAARGQCEATITVSGPGGHAASVADDANPVFGGGDVLTALRAYDEHVGTGSDDRLGEPKLTPTVLDGGEAPNRVPETVSLTVDRRSVPPETSDAFEQSLQRYLESRVAGPLSVAVDLIRPETPFPDPFVTDADAPLVRALQNASGGEIRAFDAATEASYFADDAPTVVFGPGVLADDEGGVAHAAREYVAVSDLHAAAAAVETALESLFETAVETNA